MSLVCVKDIESLKKKTLIYFCSNIALLTLPNSFVYYTPSNVSDFIRDLRRFDIVDFPIICYDSENMRLSSQGYWVFKALGYEVYVLYGGTNACEEEEVELTDDSPVKIPFCDDIKSINTQALPCSDFHSATIKDLPFFIYEVIGRDISQDKVKKLLATHKISYDYADVIISGYDAAVFGVLLSYIGRPNIKVFMGEWSENIDLVEKRSLLPETFYSIADTVYYDALSKNNEPELKNKESTNIENTHIKNEAGHYSLPRVYSQPSQSDNQSQSIDNHKCSCFLI